jgi:apolipoprotein N-acyltransferase
MLVNVSNDGWFGDSIAPHQHLQIARVRAAEAGRYMLRATNTGVTAVIDNQGGVVGTVPQFRPGVLKRTIGAGELKISELAASPRSNGARLAF